MIELSRPAFRRLVLALLVGGVPGAVFAAGSGAVPDTVRIHYGVSLIGLPIGSAAVTGHIDPSSYRIEASAKMGGLASILSSSRGAATAAGVMAQDHPVPTAYATTSANSTMTRTVRVAMNAGNVIGVDIAPPFDPQVKRVPISDADKRNVLDPLSAFVMTVPQSRDGVGPQACNRTLPIFDGGTRFDITLSYVGTRHVATKGYDGDVSVCSARYKPISGFRVDGKAAQYMADNKNLEAWLAPVAGTRIVLPFRISVLTMIGTVVIEADEFTTGAAITHADATAE